MDVRTEIEIDQADRLKNVLTGDRLHLGLFVDGEFAGWSYSSQFRQYTLASNSSAVLPKFRRQGYYSRLVKATIEEARALGYQMIISNHVVSNNDVIIAKLKLGFKISGMEILDDYGSTVKLTYYLNETRDKAYDFRTGFKRPDDKLKELFKITV